MKTKVNSHWLTQRMESNFIDVNLLTHRPPFLRSLQILQHLAALTLIPNLVMNYSNNCLWCALKLITFFVFFYDINF